MYTIKNLLHTWHDVQIMQENCHAKHNVILECKPKKGESFFLLLEEKWKNKEQQEP